jgi:quercetin dioxygenase-like cupin family protein
MDEEHSLRLREEPEVRFAAPQHVFDLDAVALALGKESQAGEGGHRQKTLYKRGSTTIALFMFGHLTRLPPHRARGVVMIQVLKGRVQIGAEREMHVLRAGSLLVLAPGVEHDLVAYEESQVLVTVHLDAMPSSN